MADAFRAPRFEALALDEPMTWKYRGQVRTWNKTVTSMVDITSVVSDDRGALAVADGILWVDGMKIYTTTGMGMRVVEGDTAGSSDREVSTRTCPWLADHRPTYTLPAMAMMEMVDRLMGAAERHVGGPVEGLDDVVVHRWLVADPAAFVRTEVAATGDSVNVALKVRVEGGYQLVATATVGSGAVAPALSPLKGGGERFDPYADHRLFHGPAYQLASWVVRGSDGADASLNSAAGGVPRMAVHPSLLDAATHLIPHDQLHLWCPELGDQVVSYPHRVENIRFSGPIPDGEVTAQVRFDGLEGPRHPAFQIRLLDGDRVWASLRLVEIAMPKGPIGGADPALRRAFLEGVADTGVSLSRVGSSTSLSPMAVLLSDWLPGTMSAVYGTSDPLHIAVQEHVAAQAGVHPSAVSWDGRVARVPSEPLTQFVVDVSRDQGLRVTGGPQLDLTAVRSFWARHFDVGRWPVEDLYYGLVQRFVSGVTLTDPSALAAIRGRGALFLGNHQVGIESLLLSIVVSALVEVPTATLAKAEHMETWLGRLIQHWFAYPEVTDPEVIVFFDRSKKEDLGRILGELGRSLAAGEKALMVHADGTRATSCRTPVEKLSSVFVDLAVTAGLPIVPVWLSGGLPVEPGSERLELPVGMAKQRYTLGCPILPDELAELPYADRRTCVLDAINGLAPADERPGAPDVAFGDAVATYMKQTGVDQVHAAMLQTLAGLANPSDEVAMLLGEGPLRLPGNAHGRWLAELARRLYGPNGRQIRVG